MTQGSWGVVSKSKNFGKIGFYKFASIWMQITVNAFFWFPKFDLWFQAVQACLWFGSLQIFEKNWVSNNLHPFGCRLPSLHFSNFKNLNFDFKWLRRACLWFESLKILKKKVFKRFASIRMQITTEAFFWLKKFDFRFHVV